MYAQGNPVVHQNFMGQQVPNQVISDLELDNQNGAMSELRDGDDCSSHPSQVQTPALESGPDTMETTLIQQMRQVSALYDSQPIRAACFSPNNSEYFAIGTNSKSLKFCKMPSSLMNSMNNDNCYEEDK